jgi:hypothetical protein
MNNASTPRAPATRPFRLIAFDGGGMHAVSYLPIIIDLETHIGTIAGSAQFDMVAGTSTGAIVAAAIKVGAPATDVLQMYLRRAASIFRRARLWNRLFYKYHSDGLRAELAAFYRRTLSRTSDLTWRELAETGPHSELELVVTLWDVTHERAAFLSTNLNRKHQAEDLWDASLADIITACCSAPTFFPPRLFQRLSGDVAFCDGGITGLNSPATFGVGLAHATLVERAQPIQVISFGAGEPDPQLSLLIEDLRDRTLVAHIRDAIYALMNSTARLKDQFYDRFGVALNVSAYVRTNQLRDPGSNLDDVAGAVDLSTQFMKGAIFYDLWRARSGQMERSRHQPQEEHTAEWWAMWQREFGLSPSRNESGAPTYSHHRGRDPRRHRICAILSLAHSVIGITSRHARNHRVFSSDPMSPWRVARVLTGFIVSRCVPTLAVTLDAAVCERCVVLLVASKLPLLSSSCRVPVMVTQRRKLEYHTTQKTPSTLLRQMAGLLLRWFPKRRFCFTPDVNVDVKSFDERARRRERYLVAIRDKGCGSLEAEQQRRVPLGSRELLPTWRAIITAPVIGMGMLVVLFAILAIVLGLRASMLAAERDRDVAREREKTAKSQFFESLDLLHTRGAQLLLRDDTGSVKLGVEYYEARVDLLRDRMENEWDDERMVSTLVDALRQLAWAYVLADAPQQAIVTAHDALDLVDGDNPGRARILINLAHAHLVLGQQDTAQATYREVLQAHQDAYNKEVLTDLAKIEKRRLVKLQSLQEIRAMFQDGLK